MPKYTYSLLGCLAGYIRYTIRSGKRFDEQKIDQLVAPNDAAPINAVKILSFFFVGKLKLLPLSVVAPHAHPIGAGSDASINQRQRRITLPTSLPRCLTRLRAKIEEKSWEKKEKRSEIAVKAQVAANCGKHLWHFVGGECVGREKGEVRGTASICVAYKLRFVGALATSCCLIEFSQFELKNSLNTFIIWNYVRYVLYYSTTNNEYVLYTWL